MLVKREYVGGWTGAKGIGRWVHFERTLQGATAAVREVAFCERFARVLESS